MTASRLGNGDWNVVCLCVLWNEKRWFCPPQYAMWVTGSKSRRDWNKRECMFEVKTMERHSPAEPQHMKNDLVQSLVRVGVSFLLFHVLPSDSMYLPELASENSPESASCEKRWYRPSQHVLWERSSKNQTRWNRTHHPIETDCTVNVLRVRESSLQNLLAGTRTSYGVETGRYTFEVKIVELHSLAEPQNSNCNLQGLVHVGLSFLLMHVLPRISMSRPEPVSDKSLESVLSAEKAVDAAASGDDNRET